MRAPGLTLLAFLALAATASAQEPTKNDLLRAIEKQLKAANETAGPSVGCVVVSRSELYAKPTGDVPGRLGSFDPKEYVKANPAPGSAAIAQSLDLSDAQNIPDNGYACGVVIDVGGLVLTPYHVIEGATKIYIHLPGRVGSYADVHAADSRSDLAVLKLITPPSGLKAIRFGDVQLSDRPADQGTVFEGKLVVLMANPYVSNAAIDRSSAALGSLTRVRFRGQRPLRGIPRSDSYYKYGTLLEHDARLNAGVTGAALLNLDGEMIGLTTSTAAIGAGDLSAGYAIPMDIHVRRIVDVLRRGEEVEYGFLGVVMDDGRGRIGIDRVTPLGPAWQAGIDGGDVITHINGTRTNSYEDLLVHIGSALAGSKIKLTLLRFGRTRDVEVTLAKFRHEQPFVASVRPEPVFGLRVDYGSILAQQLNTDMRWDKKRGVPAGVSVRELLPNSPAANVFKKLSDNPTSWLITHVNGEEVGNPAEFYKSAKGQKSLKLTIIDPSAADSPAREVSFP